jgi:hypothetical protein
MRKLTLKGFGAEVGLREPGRGKPYSDSAVREWEADEAQPTLKTIQVIAALGGVDPGWLAYGELTTARPPELGVVSAPLGVGQAGDVTTAEEDQPLPPDIEEEFAQLEAEADAYVREQKAAHSRRPQKPQQLPRPTPAPPPQTHPSKGSQKRPPGGQQT